MKAKALRDNERDHLVSKTLAQVPPVAESICSGYQMQAWNVTHLQGYVPGGASYPDISGTCLNELLTAPTDLTYSDRCGIV